MRPEPDASAAQTFEQMVRFVGDLHETSAALLPYSRLTSVRVRLYCPAVCSAQYQCLYF